MDLAAAVFEARAVARDELPESREVMFTFEVQFVWKGDIDEHVTVRTAASGSECGRHFLVGKSYLLYAGASDSGLRDDLCSRTRGRELADEDRHVLGPGRSPQANRPKSAQPPREPPRIEPLEPPVPAPGVRGCAIDPRRPPRAPFAPWLLLPIALRRRPA